MNVSDPMSKLVILGHTGFVGHRLKEYLEAKHPQIQVVGISSKDIDLTNLEASKQLGDCLDINTCVIMCSGIKSNYGNSLDTYIRNVQMAENVCRVLAEHPVRRFIFFSSIAVYGVDKHNPRITEDTMVEADTHYGLSKYDSERLLALEMARRKSGSLALLRTSTIYGPHEKIIAPTPSGFLTTYLAGGEVSLWGDGTDLREFLFIEDLVRIVDMLIGNPFCGVLNLGGGAGHSYMEAIRVIEKILGKHLIVQHKPRSKHKVDKVYDISLFRSLFPQFMFTPLEDGLSFILKHQGR